MLVHAVLIFPFALSIHIFLPTWLLSLCTHTCICTVIHSKLNQQWHAFTAGVLIIWDRIFGTFAEEKEQVYYGLLHQPETWNPLYAQFFQLAHVMRRVWAHNGIWEKLRFLFYSPSWTPGHGRMGVVYSEPYPPVNSTHTQCMYVHVHFSEYETDTVLVTSHFQSLEKMAIQPGLVFVCFYSIESKALICEQLSYKAPYFAHWFTCII